MFTSEADKIMRYTDEGETTELCKWTVDLSSLPAFQQGAMQGGGFYTGGKHQSISRFIVLTLVCQNLSWDWNWIAQK